MAALIVGIHPVGSIASRSQSYKRKIPGQSPVPLNKRCHACQCSATTALKDSLSLEALETHSPKELRNWLLIFAFVKAVRIFSRSKFRQFTAAFQFFVGANLRKAMSSTVSTRVRESHAKTA